MAAMEFNELVPLSDKTTFEIGGPARLYCEARTEEDVREAIAYARQRNLRYLILAGGSNMLLPDEGFPGLVVHMSGERHTFGGNVLEAEVGCSLRSLIHEASERGLGGWEQLAGIPGTIGGAVRGNAGAFGLEVRDILTSTQAFNANTGEAKEFAAHECDFSYRNSFFKQHPEWIITRVRLSLKEDDPDEVRQRIRETIAERERRHIQDVRAAGSYFVNPVAPERVREQFEQEKGVRSREGRVPAGWLIEQAGMKGARVGDAQSSPQHADYIVNAGNAKAEEVRELASRIKKAVRDSFGILLVEEAVVVEP